MRLTLKSFVVVALLISTMGTLSGCDPNQYNSGNWNYPQNSTYPPNYPASNGYGYPAPPPPNYGYGNGGYYPPPPPPPRPYNYDPRYDNRQYDDRNYHQHHQHDDKDQPPPQPRPNPTPPPAQVIRPSCPSGTTFDGAHCMINDKSKIRPGGKGTVNACPKGMRLSGDHCIPS